MAFTFNGSVVKKILYGSKEIDNVYYSNGKKYLFQKRYISVKIEQYYWGEGYIPIKDVSKYHTSLLRLFPSVRITFSSAYNVSVKYIDYNGSEATASGKNFSIITHLNAYGSSTIKISCDNCSTNTTLNGLINNLGSDSCCTIALNT
jgi:hypothetical protein